MGKMAEDFDGQISAIRYSYLQATSHGRWDLAPHYSMMMNKSIRPKNRVKENDDKTDLRPFKIKSGTLEDRMSSGNQAMAWCMKYQLMIEDAISRERDALLKEYDEG